MQAGQNLKLNDYKKDILRWYVKEHATIAMVQQRLHERFGVHAAPGTITRTLEIWEKKRTDPRHKPHYPLRHDALDNSDDPDVQRWLSFLKAHANLGKGNTIIVSVRPNELKQLLELLQFLGTTKSVELPKDGRIRVRLYSKQLWGSIKAAMS